MNDSVFSEYADEFEKIKDLEGQQYFELITDERGCRLVYLMNDAVESFICFENYTLNGEYDSGYSGEFSIDIEKGESGYIMIVRQGSSVFTLSFSGVRSETYLFNYGATGHFWIKGHEKMRIIDYWLGLVREKMNILGDSFCNETEARLYNLAHFLPLRFFHSVPEKYMIPNDYICESTPEAIDEFINICTESGSSKLVKPAGSYNDRKSKRMANLIDGKNGTAFTDYLINMIQKASAEYPDRKHAALHQDIVREAENYASEMRSRGYRALLFREEPFEMTDDTMDFSVTVLAEKQGITGTVSSVRKF